jgi:hypothetical protein
MQVESSGRSDQVAAFDDEQELGGGMLALLGVGGQGGDKAGQLDTVSQRDATRM